MNDEKKYFEALDRTKIPILVLDQKWHRLFALSGKNETICELEENLNQLLEKQGKYNNDIKEFKKTKNTLMQNIVDNMEGTHEENAGAVSSKKLDADRRLIDELNERIETCEDELLEIPKEIQSANKELMIASMDYCYDMLRSNMGEIEEIAAWITQVRIDLKKNIIKKQNREINNRQIYSYMHDIFGASLLDLFDLAEEDEEKYIGKKKEEAKT